MNLRSVTSTLRPPAKGAARRQTLKIEHTREFREKLFGDDMHAMRVLSLANAVTGVLVAGVLAIHAIGQAYASVAKVTAKSGVKQVDRLLSNAGVNLDTIMASWVRFVVGCRKEIVVALDWTEFDDDDHATICAYVVTKHGRATPLHWWTVLKSELAGQRTASEHALLEQLHEWLAPEGVRVEILADRGFGDQKLYELLLGFGWNFTIRFRGLIAVESAEGETKSASEWVPPTGRARMLRGAKVTQDRFAVPAVVVVHARGMKDPWCLATSHADLSASQVVKRYGRRFSIEETFRDTKDIHFGMGLRATHIRRPDRRDRMLLLVAIAHALLTLLGAASEEAGLDRTLKANTVKRRTHSLFRQGRYWYMCLPTMREEWLRPLTAAFDRIVREHAVFRELFGVI